MKITFGEQLRIIMKRRGVSVQDLAEKLGKTRQNVNNRLNNSDNMTVKEMELYTSLIGCSVSIEIVEPPEAES